MLGENDRRQNLVDSSQLRIAGMTRDRARKDEAITSLINSRPIAHAVALAVLRATTKVVPYDERDRLDEAVEAALWMLTKEQKADQEQVDEGVIAAKIAFKNAQRNAPGRSRKR